MNEGNENESMWSANAFQTPQGIQFAICQIGNPVAFTADQNFARLVIDLLETHRKPVFQKALQLAAEMQEEEEDPPWVGSAAQVVNSQISLMQQKEANYEAQRKKRLEELSEEE